MNYLDVFFLEEAQKAIDVVVHELFNNNNSGDIKFTAMMIQNLPDFYISFKHGNIEYKEILDVEKLKDLKGTILNMYNFYK